MLIVKLINLKSKLINSSRIRISLWKQFLTDYQGRHKRSSPTEEAGEVDRDL